jgi:hypothetical protein
MKQFFAFFALLFLSASVSFASEGDYFKVEKSSILDEMSTLSQMEDYVVAHEGTTVSDLLASPQFQNSEALSTIPFSPQFDFDSMDWGAFAWGFCCWPIGIFTVLLNNNKDSDSKISYFIGILTAVVISAPSYFWYGRRW